LIGINSKIPVITKLDDEGDKMIRIALAGFLHETNTFSPIPTTYESFSSRSSLLCGIYAGAEFEREFRGKSYNNSICGFYA